MGRPRKTTPPIRVGLSLPKDLSDRLDTHLKSDVENRVPHGDKSKFFESLIREFFQKLDGTFTEIESSLETANEEGI
jgi:metal-responsive CopG/Arc/MetJ family transcriptional regulator